MTKEAQWQWHELRWPILSWLVWRIGLLVVGLLANYWLPYRPSFPYYEVLLPSFGWSQWLYSWANFDGVHYLTIAENGYLGFGLIQAFFPVFPLVVRGLSSITQLDLLASGLLLNQFFSLVLTCLLWYWLKTTLNPQQAKLGLWWWLLFPTSFFLISYYNESLFLVLALGCWLAARQQRWVWAAGLAGIASATRVVGIWLLPLLLLEFLTQTAPNFSSSGMKPYRDWLLKQKWQLLLICGSSLGLLSYMLYLQLTFNDPLYFLHLQSEFGAGRQESLILWPQVVWRSSKILLTTPLLDWKYLAYLQEFLAGTLGVLLVIWGYLRRKETKLTMPLLVYSLGVLLTPTLTGTFSSMPRYLLAAWPLWLVITGLSQKSRPSTWLALAISLGLLIINTSLFIQGYWVA